MDLKNKTPVRLLTCFTVSVLFVCILQLLAIGNNSKKNHFIRLFPPHIINGYEGMDLGNSHYYFAGNIKGNLFLGNYADPKRILVSKQDIKNIKSYILTVPLNETGNPSNLHLSSDANYLYIINFVTGKILQFNISDSFHKTPVLDSIRISTNIFLPFSNNSYAFRTYDTNGQKNVLGIIKTSPFSKTIRKDILEPQLDGIFSTDGMLRYEPETSTFIYIYLYRNQIICMDDRLNVEYRQHTLDTNTYAKIKVIHDTSENNSTLASPGFYVNREVCVSHYWIFVNSGMKADNEEESDFSKNAVIDVFSLKDGRYHFSFYLPKKSGDISGMLVNENILYTIQDKTLFAYTIVLTGIKI